MKLFRKSLYLLVVICVAGTSQAQPLLFNYRKNLSIHAQQWQVTDIAFTISLTKAENPFHVLFGAVFTGPRGVTKKIEGFYNGNDQWICRFSSSAIGEWTFKTYSSSRALSEQTGKITISKNTNRAIRGMVKTDPDNAQAFIHENGEPHFMLAFELDWLFALDYENTAGVPKSTQLVDTIRNNGFNHIVMNVYAYDVGWKTDPAVPDEYFYGRPAWSAFEGTNEQPDFTRLNTNLFRHLDRVVELLQRKGMDAHLMIYVWNKKVNWPPMYSEGDNLYFDYVIRRYQAFSNVIWDVSKEALDYGRCDIPYINERISRIRNIDCYHHLITVHDYEYNRREPEKVDFIAVQSWRSELHSLMLQARSLHPGKPVVNIEHGGYEKGPYFSFNGDYTSPETVLERAYQCVFAGVYGSYYWQNAAWNIIIHNPFDKGQSFSPPRFDYYKHLSTLFRRYNYNRLSPSYPKITTNSKPGEDNFSTNAFTLFDGEGLFLMLVDGKAESIHVVVPKPGSGSIVSSWFNPFTGEFTNEAASPWSSWQGYKSPWPGTIAVLILNTK